ncbi:MAG TPA: hypothetical protein VK425_04345 [Acidimicrobiales bacterium]|nr:hypothetical protein [Acidimicrobiales bacterium]
MSKPMASRSAQPTVKPTFVAQTERSPISPGAALVLLDMLRATTPRNPVSIKQWSLPIFEP